MLSPKKKWTQKTKDGYTYEKSNPLYKLIINCIRLQSRWFCH